MTVEQLVLRRIGGGHYTAEGVFDVVHMHGEWEISEPYAADLLCGGEWWERNKDAIGTRFPTLRTAREYIQALFNLDPPSEYPISGMLGRMKRVSSGRYEVHTQVGTFQVSRDDGGWWNVDSPIGQSRIFQTKALAAESISETLSVS